jgi:methanogenic corrinoid protein MtbC1
MQLKAMMQNWLGLSALMTSTLISMKRPIALLERIKAGLQSC